MVSRICLIGIGGASCCGKTTLAKHLANILPNAKLVHQDDYAPPEDQIPVHPVHGVKDWDAPRTAIDWPAFVAELTQIKRGNLIQDSKKSHEHLNLLTPLPINEDIERKWIQRFKTLETAQFVVCEGFLMFWNEDASSMLDLRFLVRSKREALERRRLERNERIKDDSFWKDPPGIFDNIVWPAYIEAHSKHFVEGDVQHGGIKPDTHITLIEESVLDMGQMVEQACEAIYNKLRA